MKHYAGLDVSVKETSICIVDEAGRICREMKVVSYPEDLLAVLCDPAWRLERVGLEAGKGARAAFGIDHLRAARRVAAASSDAAADAALARPLDPRNHL